MTAAEVPRQIHDIFANVDVVAFDWDMTTVDSQGKLLQNQAIAHEFGNPLTLDEVRRDWNESTSFPNLMASLTNGADMDEIMKIVRRDYHNPRFVKRAYEFAAPAIRRLRKVGYQTALVSNVLRELLHTDADSLDIDLDELFDFTQAQDDCEHKKPDRRVFNPLLRHFSITANRLLYIGDEMKDMRAITDAGGFFIGVETGMVTGQEFDEVGALHAPSIKEIVEYGTI